MLTKHEKLNKFIGGRTYFVKRMTEYNIKQYMTQNRVPNIFRGGGIPEVKDYGKRLAGRKPPKVILFGIKSSKRKDLKLVKVQEG